MRWDDQISLKEIDIRNNTGNTTPAATFTNLTNNAANQVAVFSGANSTRADGDEIYLSFKLANSAGDLEEFARITAEAVDVTDGQEDGQLRFGVAKTNGTITDVFTINSTTGGETSMTFDVSGDLSLDADGGDIFFKDGGTTFGSATNTGGNLIIKSGTTTALTFSGANVTAAGTIGSGAITSTGIVTGTGFTAGSAVLAEAELELLDGLTAGTAIASKVVTTDASIDTSGQRNLTITGALTAATIDLSGAADIAGDLVLSGGADGALQFANAGENSIKIPDNQASALIIEEADNAYITFVTTNSSEAITVAKATTFSAGIADSGTIAAGTWQGTDVGVAYGGTGASSLTDGGVLLGSGTGAITAMSVLADSEMIVGDGTTDPVAESGATLRTSIGVGTGDSPQFTDLTLTDDLILNSDSSVISLGDGNDATLTHDGTTGLTIAANPIIVDSAAQIELDSGSGIITFEDSGTEVLRFTEGNSGDVTIKLVTNAKDLIFTDNGDATNMKILDAAAGINVPGEVQTTGIGYTDGDNAMTIADGGKVTFAAGFDVGSDATGDILYHNGTSYVRLARGSDDEVLTLASSVPSWAAAGGVSGAQTGITTILNTGVKIGRDTQNLIDFATTDNKIILRVNNVNEVELVENALSPVTNDGVALGTTSLGWSDVHLASAGVINWANGEMTITESDANTLTVAGGTLAGTFSGDISGGNVQLASDVSDTNVSGITATFTAGEALERGEVVYFKAGDSKMWKAVASASGTMPVVAMAAADIAEDAAGLFLLQGFIRDDGTLPSYTVGGRLYAPEAETSSQNVPEQAQPDSDGDFVQDLGFAVTAAILYFKPGETIVEIA